MFHFLFLYVNIFSKHQHAVLLLTISVDLWSTEGTRSDFEHNSLPAFKQAYSVARLSYLRLQSVSIPPCYITRPIIFEIFEPPIENEI